jgi:alpha-1,2-mannosyltransferase
MTDPELSRILTGAGRTSLMARDTRVMRPEFRSKTLYILLASCLVLLSLAYQVKTMVTIDLGDAADSAFAQGFWSPEATNGVSLRWSGTNSELFVPGIGGHAPVHMRIRLNGWRPEGMASPQVTVLINERSVATFAVANGFEDYDIIVPEGLVGLSGNLRAKLESDTFVPDEAGGGGDLRQLGVMVDEVSVGIQGSLVSPVTPALPQMLFLVGGVLALYLLGRFLLPKSGALALAILFLAALSWAVAVRRVELAFYAPWVLLIPALGIVIEALAQRAPTMARGLPLATALVLATALGLARFAHTASLAAMGIAPDLANNYAAATVLRSGGSIYDLSLPLFVGYDNPPLTALLHVPFTLFDLRTVILVFFSLNVVFLASSLALMSNARKEYLLVYPYCILAVALVLNLDPVLDSLLLGQLDSFILLLLVASYWAYRKGWDALTGFSLGLAAAIKISPALLILYFLWKRELRVFASAAVTGLLLGALSWLYAGTETIMTFVTRILPTLLAGSAQMENQSLNGFFNRLFLGGSFVTDLAQVPPLPQVRILTLLALLALVTVAAVLCRQKLSSRQDLRFDVEYSLIVIILPLISSIAWHHYMAWYVLPFVVMLNPEVRRLACGRGTLLLTLAFLFYATLCIPITLYGPSLLEGPARLLLSVRLYGAVTFYGVFAYLLARDAHTASGEKGR